MSMAPVIAAVVPVMIGAVIPTMIGITPVSRSAPVATSPHPMVIAPSPGSTYPDIAWGGANGQSFNYGRRHGWLDNDRSGSHYNRRRGRKRDPEADTDVNPCIYSGDS
jgi:hypothetical protein